ncbi:pimeloyl-ACP methyl ester carboxylesterase [Mycobacterium sp. BK086]|uniref:alpha/beta fold hydrolase n=1 Tax=Mycobacteriaceae TaxID=1762 RepID=UPI00105B4DD9|nr:alpha/beta hydrolase [Mycobacterium sp. BK086]TDO08993.1 pimeloyl-ACP methyl ester carboxylesterase [Mycobacterium sp. BK086]
MALIGRKRATLQSTPPPSPPGWFTTALAQQAEHSEIDVDDCRIHLRAWGSRDLPPLLFVHGGAAHSGWWDHIAPFFTQTHRVIAPDLSGHGDSGTRPEYRPSTWAREVLAAAQAEGPSGRPTIVGHSMGGSVASAAAGHYGEQIDSIVVIDSPLRDEAPEEERLRDRKHHSHGYRSKDEILERFTPVPAQSVVLPYIWSHIADQSIRRTPEGWFWKFDPAIFHVRMGRVPADEEKLDRAMAEMRCRIGYIRSEAGLVSPEMAERIRSMLQLRGPFVELAEAGHHPMLDQPLALVATIRTLLEMWSIT